MQYFGLTLVVVISKVSAQDGPSLKDILDPVFYTFAGLVVFGLGLTVLYINRKSIIHLCFKRKQKDTNITEYKSTATEQDSSRSQNDENSYDALQLGSEESDHSYGQVIPSHGPNTYANTRSQAANVDNLYEALKSTGVNNEHPYGDAAKTSSEASHNVEANPYQMLEKQSGSSEHIYRKIETPNKQSKSKISQPGENQSEKGFENLGVYE